MERRAAILYPGEMGCAVAKVFVAAGWDVVTHLWGPSLACRRRRRGGGYRRSRVARGCSGGGGPCGLSGAPCRGRRDGGKDGRGRPA